METQNKKSKLVSIIVLTFNRSRYLKDALDAILRQTYENFEVIVVDNYSKDDTKEVINQYIKKDSRIRFFQNQGSIPVDRNFGISKCQGEFVAFCDDDDVWFPTKLKIEMEEFEIDPNIGMVCSGGKIFTSDEIVGRFPSYKQRDFTYDSLIFANYVITSNAVIRRSVIDEVGVFDETLKICEDYDLWLRIAEKYKIKYVNQDLIKYRIHGANITTHTASDCTYKSYMANKAVLLKYSSSRPKLVEQSLRALIERAQNYKIRQLLKQKKIGKIEFLRDRRISLLRKLKILDKILDETWIFVHYPILSNLKRSLIH